MIPSNNLYSFFICNGQSDQKRKNQPPFSNKMQIFYTQNKQTGQLISPYGVTLTKLRKIK